jgi:hypothetical protein
MPAQIPDQLQLIGPEDWKVRGRAGNDSLMALAIQGNLMIAQAGAPPVQSWSPRSYSGTSPVVGWPLRWCVPGVPKVKILVVYDYTGSLGDGGRVTILWRDPANGVLADLGSFQPSNGGPLVAELTGDVEGEEGPDYYLGLEAQTASGRTITIRSFGVAPMGPRRRAHAGGLAHGDRGEIHPDRGGGGRSTPGGGPPAPPHGRPPRGPPPPGLHVCPAVGDRWDLDQREGALDPHLLHHL